MPLTSFSFAQPPSLILLCSRPSALMCAAVKTQAASALDSGRMYSKGGAALNSGSTEQNKGFKEALWRVQLTSCVAALLAAAAPCRRVRALCLPAVRRVGPPEAASENTLLWFQPAVVAPCFVKTVRASGSLSASTCNHDSDIHSQMYRAAVAVYLIKM